MDIVELLRIQQENGIFGLSDEHEFVGWKEAADEIERLRSDVQKMSDQWNKLQDLLKHQHDEIERLRNVNLLQAKWLYEEQQSYKQLQEKVAQWLKEKE